MKLFFGCLGLVTFSLVLLVIGSILNGYVLTRYWEWFAIPLIPGAPTISLIPAIGLAMMARLLMGNYMQAHDEKDKKNEKEEKVELSPLGKKLVQSAVAVIVVPGMTFVTGWVLHSFM